MIIKRGVIFMPGWDEILRELNEAASPSDQIRRKYLKKISDYTGRT